MNNVVNTRELVNKLNAFVQRYGLNHQKVFSDLLDYIIAWFDPGRNPIPGWTYTAEQDLYFRGIMISYFVLMKERLADAEWYDAWGDLFMDLVGNFAGYRGQFFTPEPLCSAMAELTGPADSTLHKCDAFGVRPIVNDPACGSSRTLLAANASMLKDGKAKPYLIGEDLDHLCVKMSAINMCVHCCFGEVVCHNSIEEPGSVSFGYIINEGMYPFPGLPSIRKYENPEKFICCRPWFRNR